MSNKRSRQLSPEQLINNNNKKQNINCNQQNMDANKNDTADVFSWNKLCSLLDDKLKDVAKKEDVQSIRIEMDELRVENTKLRNEVKVLSSRIEQIDRRSRSSNIVVSGLVCVNAAAAKAVFNKLCTDSLNVYANVVTVRDLPAKNTFLFTLESQLQVVNVLGAKDKLKGGTIFMHKDYTKDEQNIRYNLRKLNKTISNLNMNLKVRLGEFCSYIDNRKYSWALGKIVAYSVDDHEFLIKLLSKSNYSIDVIVKDNSVTNANASTSINNNTQ